MCIKNAYFFYSTRIQSDGTTCRYNSVTGKRTDSGAYLKSSPKKQSQLFNYHFNLLPLISKPFLSRLCKTTCLAVDAYLEITSQFVTLCT